jgi:hypothetical protein
MKARMNNMTEPKFNVVVLDFVEDATWDDKKYLRLMDKSGGEWRLGQHLIPKYPWVRSLPSGTAVKLIMDAFVKNGESKEYVKDIEKASEALAKQNATKITKNPRLVADEAMVAVKGVVDLLCCEKATPVPEDIKEMTFKWMRNALKSATE